VELCCCPISIAHTQVASAGLMQMIDQGEQDDKIIGVHADDPEYRDYSDISEIPAHRLIEIRRQVLSNSRSQAFACAAGMHKSICL